MSSSQYSTEVFSIEVPTTEVESKRGRPKKELPTTKVGPCRHEEWSAHREYTPKHFQGAAIFEFLKCDNCGKQSPLLYSISPRPKDATAEEPEPDQWIRVRIERGAPGQDGERKRGREENPE